MKTVLKSLFTVVLALGITTAMAQPPRHGHGPREQKESPEQIVEKRVEMMAQKLNLTDAQKEQVKELSLQNMPARPSKEQMEARKADAEKMKSQMEERRAEMQKKRAEYETAMQKILTPEQFQQWKEGRKERAEKARQSERKGPKDRKPRKDSRKKDCCKAETSTDKVS